MTKNIQDVLGQGEKLDSEHLISSSAFVLSIRHQIADIIMKCNADCDVMCTPVHLHYKQIEL